MNSGLKAIYVDGEIRLDRFLKWSKFVSTGGHSKYLIHNNMVAVNGVLENRRTRKLRQGDIMQVENMGSFLVSNRQGGLMICF